MEYLTKEKYDELIKELEQLKTEKRKEIAEHLEYAKSLGDISENAEYHEARTEQANVEDRISKLESLLKSANIVSETDHKGKVEVGSKVVVKRGDSMETYKIVGSEEVDISAGKLSITSPLGSDMLDKKKGETFFCKTPKGVTECKIISIE
ncbi:MAG: transcription elongation factor GreA [bacterium]|nr:transcription elongation factor GreA [bacterium]